MPIQTVAISNTFNQFRITTNSVIDEVNKLSDGTGNLVINSITANTLITPINLNVAGNTGSDVIALASETLNVVGTNGISTVVSSNTVIVDLNASGASSGTYGSSTQVPVIVVNTQGRITSVSNTNVATTLNLSANTGTGNVALLSQLLNLVGTNGISTSVSGNSVSVNLSSNLTLADLTLSAENANSIVYLNSSKQLRTVPAFSFNGTNVGINNSSPGSTLDVKGVIRLTGATTGYVGLQAASSGTNTTYTLPASDGLNGQVLQTNGTGSLSWVNQSAGGGGANTGSGTSTSRTAFTATGGQTTFSVSYVVGQVDVYMNGSKLIVGNDFTATNGTSIVLAAPAVAGDVVEAVVYSTQWISSGTSLYYANGSVGVGTTNPGARFHVASANTAFAIGTIRIDGANSAGVVNAPVTINAVTDATGNGASQLYFETRADSGSLLERMRIDSSGRVGVGGTPSYRFDVQGGTASFSGSSGVNAIRVAGAGGSWFWLDNPTTTTFRISSGNTAGTNPFTFTDGGSLGVGTSSPSFKFHVYSASNNRALFESGTGINYLRLTSNNGGGNYGSSIEFRDGATDSAQITSVASGQLRISTLGQERLTVDSSGNVGIGTTNAGTAGLSLSQNLNLSWEASATESVANLFRQASSAALVMSMGYKRSATPNGFASSFGSSLAKTAISLGTTAGAITFYTDTAATTAVGTDVTPTPRMTIDSSGNVGIGATSVVWDERLSVRPSGNTVGIAAYSASASYTGSLFRAQAENSTQTAFKLYEGRGAGGGVNYWVDGSGAAFFNGNVGIGTASPTVALDVVGAAIFTRNGKPLVLNPDYLSAGTRANISVGAGMALAFSTNGDANERFRITSTGGITSSDLADAVGYKGIPLNEQSAAYTLVIGDMGKSIVHPASDNNARTFTIPANGTVAFPVGTTITFINMANTVTIAITTDTMYLAGAGTTGSRTLAAYGMATAVKMTSTTWIISGNGLT